MPIGINKVSRNSQIGSDIPDSEVDQFEWGGPVEDRYDGSIGSFSINTNSAVFEGSFSLKASTGVSNETIMSYPGDNAEDLPNYPTRGDWVQGIVEPGSGDSTSRVYAFSESGTSVAGVNGYLASVSVNGGVFRLRRGDQTTNLDSGGTPEQSQSYLVNIYSNSTDIEVEFIDRSDGSVAASLSASDSTYSGSGFGFGARDEETFDDFRYSANYGLS